LDFEICLKFGIWLLLFFFSFCSHFVQLIGPIHAYGRFFNFDVTAGADFKVYRAVFVYFIDSAMDAGDSDYFISFLKILDKRFLVLGLFCLWSYKEKPKNKYH